MTSLVKWILGTIAMVMAYVTLLISANNAFAVPTKGELRSIVIEKTQTSLPNCSRELQRLGTVGDYSWCKTNIQVIMDNEMNQIYKRVLRKFRFFDNKRHQIRKVQRQWMRHRNSECFYTDTTDGILADVRCKLDKIALSIHYLKRLEQIQFDPDGLKEIDRVIVEYRKQVG